MNLKMRSRSPKIKNTILLEFIHFYLLSLHYNLITALQEVQHFFHDKIPEKLCVSMRTVPLLQCQKICYLNLQLMCVGDRDTHYA